MSLFFKDFLFKNYINVFFYILSIININFFRYLINIFVVVVFLIVGGIIFLIIVVFVFVRLNFKGKELIFIILFVIMMILGEMMVIFNFVIVVKFGWVDV